MIGKGIQTQVAFAAMMMVASIGAVPVVIGGPPAPPAPDVTTIGSFTGAAFVTWSSDGNDITDHGVLSVTFASSGSTTFGHMDFQGHWGKFSCLLGSSGWNGAAFSAVDPLNELPIDGGRCDVVLSGGNGPGILPIASFGGNTYYAYSTLAIGVCTAA